MKAIAPVLAERGWGRIVNVCSTAAKRPSQTMPEYSVAKAAELEVSPDPGFRELDFGRFDRIPDILARDPAALERPFAKCLTRDPKPEDWRLGDHHPPVRHRPGGMATQRPCSPRQPAHQPERRSHRGYPAAASEPASLDA